MYLLAVDSSAKSASVAILRDGEVLVDSFLSAGLTHSETLVPMMRRALSDAHLTPDQIDYCAVSNGPGSFTGVRIGVCAVKGFALPNNIPCVEVSTLEAMAYNAVDHNGLVCGCMDARRNQVYNALFMCEDGFLTRVTQDRAVRVDELCAQLIQSELPVFLVGDGAYLCYNSLGDCDKVRLLSPPCLFQRALGVGMAAMNKIAAGDVVSPGMLLPTYLRPSQAERERAAKLGENKSSD